MDEGKEFTTITRQELYEQVWKEPLTKLGQRYGLSGLTLARICDAHDVPRPSSGYWALVRLGLEVEKPALPDVDEETAIEIREFRRGFVRDGERFRNVSSHTEHSSDHRRGRPDRSSSSSASGSHDSP
jgi:hypothetical protein